MCSETCVAAALDACAKLSEALAPYRPNAATADWAATVAAAAASGVNLCGYGWYVRPDIHVHIHAFIYIDIYLYV